MMSIEKANFELAEVEKKAEELKHRRGGRKIPQVCLYCGDKADVDGWNLVHQCPQPYVIEIKKWKKPTRPKQVVFYEVEYYGKVYTFNDYESSLKFRRLLWLDEIPLSIVSGNKELSWFVNENGGK